MYSPLFTNNINVNFNHPWFSTISMLMHLCLLQYVFEVTLIKLLLATFHNKQSSVLTFNVFAVKTSCLYRSVPPCALCKCYGIYIPLRFFLENSLLVLSKWNVLQSSSWILKCSDNYYYSSSDVTEEALACVNSPIQYLNQ